MAFYPGKRGYWNACADTNSGSRTKSLAAFGVFGSANGTTGVHLAGMECDPASQTAALPAGKLSYAGAGTSSGYHSYLGAALGEYSLAGWF